MSGEPSNDQFLSRVDFMHLPIGVYVLDRDGRFLGLNDGARRILGLPASGPVERRITDFHAEPARFRALADAALAAERRNDGFEKAVVHLSVGDRPVYVEDYLKPLRDPDGGLAGYVGCMVDITDDHMAAQRSEALQAKVEELTLDIGRILHANTSTLLMVTQTLSAAATALDPDFPRDLGGASPVPEETAEAVKREAAELAQALERLLEAGDPERRLQALPAERWKMLEEQVERLSDYERIVPVEEMRNPALRASAVAIARACHELQPKLLPREPVREVVRRAMDLQRRICFADLLTTRTTVVQMDYTLRALRDFVTAEVRAPEKSRRLGVAALMQEAIAQLAEFARTSNVEIVWRQRPDDLDVVGQERDLLRALANLLHNAIKYSWQRDRANAPWVAIKTEERDGRAVIELETWGVPITRDEMAQGLIYQMGYRGKWSTDRGRLGTGIGLTDAQRVAQAHGGELRVESKPAQPSAFSPDDEEYYRQPFLTKVTLLLPAVV